MKNYTVNSVYRQFYVADRQLEPEAPEDWSEAHLQQHHNTEMNITALCTSSDTIARITSYGPNERVIEPNDAADFDVDTCIEVPSGEVGIFGWPWELMDSYSLRPGAVRIRFRGFKTLEANDQSAYFVVEITEALQNPLHL